MVIDAINYAGEKDILEIRLNILSPHVDEFVIVEYDTTFSGLPKPFYFLEQEERFASFKDKIKYFPISQADLDADEELNRLADESPSVPDGMHWWHREFRQKEYIKRCLEHLNDEDTVYVSDCDEIWKPKEIGDGIYKLQQIVYAYWLNNRSSEQWAGTFVSKYKNIKDGILNYMRMIPPPEYVERLGLKEREFLPDGGWHFTSMGGIEAVKKKLESYGHQEFNTEEIKNNLEQAISTGKDFIGRDFRYTIDEESLPEFLRGNRERYQHLMK